MKELTFRGYLLRRLDLDREELLAHPNDRGRFLLMRMLDRAFTSPSLSMFWRYWNPVYGYFLSKYIYRPCRRILPRWTSLLLTFAFCGFFLHDALAWPAAITRTGKLFPPPHRITAWFTLIAAGILLSEALGLRFDALSRRARIALHLAYLAITLTLALLLP
jgi:hypothetical protein